VSRPLLAALGAAALCVLAGCGSNSPAAATPAPTAAPTLPPGSDPFPARDTPIADAPPALAAAWKPYGVTIIPGHSTVDPDSRWPQAVDASGGIFSAAEAQALGAAVMRTQVLAAWADEHVQIPFEPHLMNTPFLLGSAGVALAEGTSVHTPDCGEYPTAIAVHAPAPAVRDALVKAGQNVGTAAIPVEMSFSGPCTVTGTTRTGEEVTVDTLPAARLLVMVELRNDPVLGPVAHLDAAASCADPVLAGACGG